jgi:hypothetical protein
MNAEECGAGAAAFATMAIMTWMVHDLELILQICIVNTILFFTLGICALWAEARNDE